jgi:NADP-dependent 3-hydroxy acid dehydrogenase YdfG
MVSLKPLAEQVIVITAASSGIGLVTARMAARAGARVVLAARNVEALKALEDEVRRGGGEASAAPMGRRRREGAAGAGGGSAGSAPGSTLRVRRSSGA